MSLDKSDICLLEGIHSDSAMIQRSLSDLYYALINLTPRTGNKVAIDRLTLMGASFTAKNQSEAAQALCDSLRTLIVTSKQSTEGK